MSFKWGMGRLQPNRGEVGSMPQRLHVEAAPTNEEQLWGALEDEFDWGQRSAALVVLLMGVLTGFVIGFLAGVWL
jgi:hypothetical protein